MLNFARQFWRQKRQHIFVFFFFNFLQRKFIVFWQISLYFKYVWEVFDCFPTKLLLFCISLTVIFSSIGKNFCFQNSKTFLPCFFICSLYAFRAHRCMLCKEQKFVKNHHRNESWNSSTKKFCVKIPWFLSNLLPFGQR